jgi:hypothetical protein
MSSTLRKPSSANDGFFQALPVVPNQFHDDVGYQRVLKRSYPPGYYITCHYASVLTLRITVFLPRSIIDDISPEFERFGQEVLSKRILDCVTDAEKNVPYLKGGGRDAFGKRTSELVVGEGWRELQEFGIQNGYDVLWLVLKSYKLTCCD